MANFGALTDHFSMASDDLILVSSSKKMVEKSRADARDENGDIADTDYYGNADEDLFEASCEYALKSNSLDLSTLTLGELSAGVIAESMDVETEGGAFPAIKVSGKLGTDAITAPSGYLNTFALPAITIYGRKQAQAMGFTVSSGKLTSCKLSAKIELVQQDNGVGEPVAFGVSGGTGTVEAEFVRISDAPDWGSLESYLTETLAPTGAEEGQATHHVHSAAAGFTLSRGTE